MFLKDICSQILVVDDELAVVDDEELPVVLSIFLFFATLLSAEVTTPLSNRRGVGGEAEGHRQLFGLKALIADVT